MSIVAPVVEPVGAARLAYLRELARKVLWLSTWMVHHANRVRPSRDGVKVGGHQASSASLVTLMTALYFDVLRPNDRVAVKPHASPALHAIEYLFGHEPRERLEAFRAFGGAQAYPSRTKDAAPVDFSTGSVGLGVAITVFAALVQEYVRLQGLAPSHAAPGRMVALVGDAEFDEGNVFEAMLEGWKHDVRNVWWIIDYNRQSLDSVVSDRLFTRLGDVLRTTGFEVVTLKYGKKLEAAFAQPGGEALRRWIDDCPNSLYAALTFKGGASWRQHLTRDLGHDRAVAALVDQLDDDALHALMTNLGGHDLDTILEAFHAVNDDRPRCFLAYTIKGFGLPLAGHKDNHSGLLTPAEVETLQRSMGVPPGQEWEPFAGLGIPGDDLRAFIASVPLAGSAERVHRPARVAVPDTVAALAAAPETGAISTQTGFGRIMADVGGEDSDFARRIVTTSPDVTVSTNLSGWVNKRGIFARDEADDIFRQLDVRSPLRWRSTPSGQHFELGIAEHNLFLMLGALGLAGPLFGTRLFPVGTLYDPFVLRGLDALNYACYQGARFMLVATPSGVTLAPEGGAHQSIITPLIGMSQDGIVAFEPAFVDELSEIMRWGFGYMQDERGGSVYLRLSTRPVEQPRRVMSDDLRADLLEGAYWLVEPAGGAELAIVYTGAVAPEAMAAYRELESEVPGVGVLAVTSADRLHAGWRASRRAAHGASGPSHIDRLLATLAPDAALVSVVDGHPATLSWLGSVRGHRIFPLGVERFGQSGDIPDLYRAHGIDTDSIIDSAAAACLERSGRSRRTPSA